MTINQYKKRLEKAKNEIQKLEADLKVFNPKTFLNNKKKYYELFDVIEKINCYASNRIEAIKRINSIPDNNIYELYDESLTLKMHILKTSFLNEMQNDHAFYRFLFEIQKTRILDPTNTSRLETQKDVLRMLGEQRIKFIQNALCDDFNIIEL